MRLPNIIKTPDLPPLVARYKAIRLHALTTDPDAFSSTLARETAFTGEVWASRILNPLATSLVAVRRVPEDLEDEISPPDSDTQELAAREWMGQVTLLGPVFHSTPSNDRGKVNAGRPWVVFDGIDFHEAADAVPRIRRGSRVVYILAAMYVRPEARGAGYGKMLVERALGSVKESCGLNRWAAVVVAMVSQGNEGAKRLYERAGFVVNEGPVNVGGHEELVLEWEYKGSKQVD
jgi:GNAT superfamily N-acetyltransferase